MVAVGLRETYPIFRLTGFVARFAVLRLRAGERDRLRGMFTIFMQNYAP